MILTSGGLEFLYVSKHRVNVAVMWTIRLLVLERVAKHRREREMFRGKFADLVHQWEERNDGNEKGKKDKKDKSL